MTGNSRIPRGPADLPGHVPSEAGLQPFAHTSDKQLLRKALMARRAAIDPADKALWDARIGARLLRWWQGQSAGSLGVYWALKGEVDLSATFAELAAQGVQLVLPVVLAKHAPLGFAAWTPGEAMHKDAMGVAVPEQLRMVARPPALLVPCLGFDGAGYRLGYGGGYYDRTLEGLPRPATAGIAYACQQADFDHLPHDIPLDIILTEIEQAAP